MSWCTCFIRCDWTSLWCLGHMSHTIKLCMNVNLPTALRKPLHDDHKFSLTTVQNNAWCNLIQVVMHIAVYDPGFGVPRWRRNLDFRTHSEIKDWFRFENHLQNLILDCMIKSDHQWQPLLQALLIRIQKMYWDLIGKNWHVTDWGKEKLQMVRPNNTEN